MFNNRTCSLGSMFLQSPLGGKQEFLFNFINEVSFLIVSKQIIRE